MPQCQLCIDEKAKKTEYGVINSNHLAKHNFTLAQYIEKYGDPNTDMAQFKADRPKASPKAIADKIKDKPKRELTYHQSKTIDELYELEKTIVVPDKFKCIMEHNIDEFYKMIDLAYQYKRISLDTETTGLDMFEDKITDIIITIYEPTYTWNCFIPMLHVDRDNKLVPGQLTPEFVVAKLKPLLEDPNVLKATYNDYFDEIMLWTSYDVNLKGLVPEDWDQDWSKKESKWNGGWDGLHAANILNENEESKKLKDIYKKYLHEREKDPQIKGLGVETFEEQFGKIKFYRVPLKVATCYGAKDGYMTRGVEEFQKPYIETTGRLREVLYGIEFPLIPVLVEMRKEGIGVDMAFAQSLREELEEERDKTKLEIFKALGEINLNSPKQLSNALFNVLKLPRIDGDSTKASVLEALAEEGYEVAEWLSDYKKKEKLIGTYLGGKQAEGDEENSLEKLISKRTGRIHCRFNQSGTKTGRFSSSDPNLQNIPAKFGKIRRMFVARPGNALISCDYSQIEPRLLAHVADDPIMIEAYKKGVDIYSFMAAHVFSLVSNKTAEKLNYDRSGGFGKVSGPIPTPDEQIHTISPVKKQLVKDGFIFFDVDSDSWLTKALTADDCYDGTLYRKFMKTLLLGMMYSMSEKGLSNRLKISEEDALDIMNYFFKTFPNIKKHMKQLQAQCKEDGFIETFWGRKRRLPDIWSDTWFIRKKAERQVLNSEIQGSAADVMKIAMLRVGYDQRIKDLGGKLLLTVHDELILEGPKKHAVQIAKYVIEDMVGVCDLKVPMKVDAEIFVDGRWNGDSVVLKNKKADWTILYEKNVIAETDIPWAV